MRGRPNDPHRARAKAQAHAKHAYFCSCGKIVRGNGGKASHAYMHERRGDWQERGEPPTWQQPNDAPGTRHTWITEAAYDKKFPKAA